MINQRLELCVPTWEILHLVKKEEPRLLPMSAFVQRGPQHRSFKPISYTQNGFSQLGGSQRREFVELNSEYSLRRYLSVVEQGLDQLHLKGCLAYLPWSTNHCDGGNRLVKSLAELVERPAMESRNHR